MWLLFAFAQGDSVLKDAACLVELRTQSSEIQEIDFWEKRFEMAETDR